MLRAHRDLPDDLERIVRRVIGCCIEVHRTLGPGLLEKIYQRAVSIELEWAGIKYERERVCPVTYRGRLICRHRLDLVVENCVVLEIKAAERLHPLHQAQVLSYLRITGLRIALLVNFNSPILRDGLRRIVL